MAPVRLLLAIGSLGGGGSERQLIGLLRRLDRSRFTPHLYLMRREGPLLEEVPEDVPVHAFWDHRQPPRVNWPGRIHGLMVADLRRLLAKWRIECVYDRNFHTTLVTGGACRGVPRISTVVSDPLRDLHAQETRLVGWKRRLLARAYRRASRVVTVSEGVRQAVLEDFGLPPDQVVAIPSPVDLARIDRLANMPPAIALEEGRFHVVTAGRLLEPKGLLELVQAVGSLVNQRGRRQLQVHLLGEGPLRGELQWQIKSLRLADHVLLEGFQANPYAIFRRSDALCHPSHYEGLPNVLLEALACRLPVLASDCRSGPREILQDGQFGVLFPPRDPDALAAALESVLDDPAPARGRIEAARRHVEQHYGSAQSIRRLEDLIWQLAR